MSVERWTIVYSNKMGMCTSRLSPDGDFVLYEDYEELRNSYQSLVDAAQEKYNRETRNY